MVFYTVCRSEFSIAHGGADSCRRYVNRPRYKKAEIAVENSKTVTLFFDVNSSSAVTKAGALFA